MEYIVIERETTEKLSTEINEMIRNGWKPLGGVSCSLSESDDYQFFVAIQAMTRGI